MPEEAEKNVLRIEPSLRISISLITTSTLFWLSACASDRVADQPFAESNESSRQIEVVGYAVFFGEFRLFDSEEDFKRGGGVCVSGALPLAEQRVAARELNYSMVKVVGMIRPWILSENMLSLNYEGSDIQNGCDGKEVIFASSMKGL